MHSSSIAIETLDLTKKYGAFTAVNKISLQIKSGEIFGLLGPNGAGKTTTISMLATLNTPTSGLALVDGINVTEHPLQVRERIGIVFQDPSLDGDLTGRENLDFHGRLYHVPSDERKKRIADVLKLVDLEDKSELQVKTYSGGMKRRLEIARSLLHVPKIIFLDEPTLGLDVQTRRKLWEYIRKLSAEHKITIILTTHYLEEADSLCDRVAIIDRGEIKALDTPQKLKSTMGGDVISIDTHDAKALQKMLETKKVGKQFAHINHTLSFTIEHGAKMIPKIVEWAQDEKIELLSISVKQPSLEDVFVQLTGHAIRQEESNGKDRARQQMKIRGGH